MGNQNKHKMVSRTLVIVAIAIIASARALPPTPDDVVPEGVELLSDDDTDIEIVDADVQAVVNLTTTVVNDMKDLDAATSGTATNTGMHAVFNKIMKSAAFAKSTEIGRAVVAGSPSTTEGEAAAIAAFDSLPDDLQDSFAGFLQAAFKDLKVAEADLRDEVTRLQNTDPVTDADVIKASEDELHKFEMDPQGQVMQDASANLLAQLDSMDSMTDADTAQICASVNSFMATSAGKAIADVLGAGRALGTEVATDAATALSAAAPSAQKELQEEKTKFTASPQGQAMANVQTGINRALAKFKTECTA